MQKKFIMAGVMGWPIEHSRSPTIHNYWIKEHNINGAYGHFPVQPNHLEAAIDGLRALGLAGCNITIPHKVAAMKHVDWVDPKAQRIGAINTIVCKPDGMLCGFNHDGFGYIQSLYEAQPTWHASAGPVVMLGAGGASRSILVSLLDSGASEIRLLNRTQSKADELAAEFGPLVTAYPWSELNDTIEDCKLLVNTTSLGMQGQAPLEIDLSNLKSDALVSDIIYAPLETPLLAAAKARGNTTVNGLGMLLHQARPAFEAWFGVLPDVSQKLRNVVIASF